MRVAIGLSGGVDSSVAALLLKEAGHEVVGITMKLWREGYYKGGERESCFSAKEPENIARIEELAKTLGIEYQAFDCFEAYNKEVIGYFRDTYLEGRTPNPCVRCNELVKFGLLPRLAADAGLKFDKFATGHYARIEEVDGRYCVARGVDDSKDQSYFLCRLSQEQLSKTLFPLGGLTKKEIRKIAAEKGLITAERPDSQDFYSGDKAELIGEPDRPGNIVDVRGKVLGTHNGFWHYTVGQRKGLGIGGGTPYYVVDLNACKNEVIIGFEEEAVKTSLEMTDVVYGAMSPDENDGEKEIECFVKVRSAGVPRGPAFLKGTAATFPNGIRGVAPGQSAVFYDTEGRILVSGIIK